MIDLAKLALGLKPMLNIAIRGHINKFNANPTSIIMHPAVLYDLQKQCEVHELTCHSDKSWQYRGVKIIVSPLCRFPTMIDEHGDGEII